MIILLLPKIDFSENEILEFLVKIFRDDLSEIGVSMILTYY